MRLFPLGGALSVAAFVIALGGCAHITYPSGVTPGTPTPAPSGTSTVTCNSSGSASAQIVAITPLITPTSVPTYGVIGGYALVVGGSVSQVAEVINVLPTDTIQFFNNDSAGSQVSYSAVGIPNVTAFPAATYTFPPSQTAAVGTQISSTAAWSTGLLGPQCYSQAFTLAGAGTYYFGDYTYYGLANIRNVIVASTSAPQAVRRR